MSCSVGVSGTYDASLSAPGKLEASLKADATVAVSAATAVGGELLVFTIGGGTSFTADTKLVLVVSGETCTLDGSVEFANTVVVGTMSLKARVIPSKPWEIWSGDFPIAGTDGSYTATGTIFEYPNEPEA